MTQNNTPEFAPEPSPDLNPAATAVAASLEQREQYGADEGGTAAQSVSRFELLRTLIAGAFIIVYAYDTWEAIAFWIEWSGRVEITLPGITLLLVMLLAPLVIWLVMVRLFWQHKRWMLALWLLVGLGLSAMLFVEIRFFFFILFGAAG